MPSGARAACFVPRLHQIARVNPASPTVAVVIPARYASSRFPGKLLADRSGRPLVEHAWRQARQARCVTRILVATDDDRIADAVRAFGGEVRMTRADHPNGTSRIAEVAEALGEEIIVNVQGDEPELDPALIERVAATLATNTDCPMATLACPLSQGEDPANPNIVKVVLDQRGRAMYFSRSRIPFDRDNTGTALPLRHIGLYAYRRDFLATYVNLSPTPLEQTEQLEQLRALEHGYGIAVGLAEAAPAGIDTPEQYEAFLRRLGAAAGPG